MISDLDFSVALIAIAPFLAAIMAPFVFRVAKSYAGWILAIVPASIFAFLVTQIEPIANRSFLLTQIEWIPAYQIKFSFLLDGLSLAFALLISGIGTIIVIYSGAYMAGHKHQGRFFSFILMFMGSMLGLVLANDLVVMFVFWELTSITSFLLIGFDHSRQAARRAAIQALVITGGGGLLLLAGIALMHYVSLQATGGVGTWSMLDFRGSNGLVRNSTLYVPILILFLGGAFTKSAQFPFHFWLPNAMEAPTPVSAFLHSATMVKAGVYLLARMNPVLGDTEIWKWTLVLVGGITLLWGATLALRQTDLKQMLAQTTVASLGLLVMLLGVNTEVAVAGAVVYLAAHAFYKAGLFLVSGIIDHGTGTREVTDLGGLRAAMPLTFAAAVLGGLSMAGLPVSFGYLAKEEMYAGLTSGEPRLIIALVAAVLGNAMMMAIGLAIAILPFFGGRKPTPKSPHEGSFGLWSGPLALGAFAVAAAFFVYQFGHYYLEPVGGAILDHKIESHLALIPKLSKPALWLSVLTWILGGLIFWKLMNVRLGLRKLQARTGWTFDDGFDWSYFSIVRLSDALTRFLHHGRLEIYLVVVFVALAAALYVPLLLVGTLPEIGPIAQLRLHEWGVVAIALVGLAAVLVARTRLVAIVSLGIQGFAVALIFLLYGAPDLSFTQFMVEVLSVVILALVMTRLYLDHRDRRVLEETLRDGTIAVIVGVGISMLLLTVLQTPLDMKLTDFYAATSVPIAHGHNIVNVILVDYRGLDTLGEISVVMTAGIAIFALIRMRGGGPQTGIGAAPRKRAKRRAPAKAVKAAKAGRQGGKA